MSESGATIQDQLIARIEAAFADLEHPGDESLLHSQCFDESDLEDFFGGIAWRDVPSEVIERNNASLCFFSPIAFRYYLPAFLIWVLRNHRTSDSSTVSSTLFNLDPDSGDLREFTLSKFSCLTPPQRQAVTEFLRFMRDHSAGRVDERAAIEALSYWEPLEDSQ
jgi:hypothetical protein